MTDSPNTSSNATPETPPMSTQNESSPEMLSNSGQNSAAMHTDTPIGTGPSLNNNSGDSTNSPSPFRRIFGILLWLFVIAAVIVACGLYYVYTQFLDPVTMKAQFKKQVERVVGLSVAVEEIRLEFPTVLLTGVSVGSAAVDPEQPRITAESVTVTPDLWELLGGKILFDHLALSSASVKLTRRGDGTMNLGPLGSMASGSPGATAAASGTSFEFPFRDVALNGVSVAIDDKAHGREISAILEHLELARPLFGRDMPLEANASFDNTASISIKGSFLPPSGIDVVVRIDGGNMKRLSEWLPAGMHISSKLETSLETSSVKAHFLFSSDRGLALSDVVLHNSEFELTGGMSLSSVSPVTGVASVTILPLSAKLLLELAGPFLPTTAKGLDATGKVSGGLQVRLDNGGLATWEAWVTPEEMHVLAPGLPTSLDGISGNLTYVDGKLTWKGFSAQIPGAKISSSHGFIEAATQHGETDMTIALDAAEVFKNFRKMIPVNAAHLNPSGKLEFQGKFALAGLNSSVNGKLTAAGMEFSPLAGGFPVGIERGNITLADVSATAGRISVEEITAKILGVVFQGTGVVVNGPDPAFEHLMITAELDLAQMQKNLPAAKIQMAQGFNLGGKAQLTATLEGTLKKPKPAATIKLSGASVMQTETGFSMTDIAADAHVDEKSVKLQDGRASFAGGKVAFDGNIRDFSKPQIVATGTLSGVDLAVVRTLLAKVFPTFPGELETSGKADLDLSVTGAAGAPSVNGSAVLSCVTVRHPSLMRPLTSIVGPVRFNNKGLSTEGLQAAWGSSTARVAGSISDFGKFALNLTYHIQPLDMTDIGGFFLAGTGYQAHGTGQGTGKVTGSIEKMILDGVAQLPSGLFEAPVSKTNTSTFKFPFTDLNAPFRLASGVLDVQGAKAKIFGGTMQTSGKIFLAEKPIRFLFDTTGTSIDVENFMSTNTRLKNVVTGNMNMSLKTGGNTTGLESLDGGLDLGMKNGTYQAPPVAAQLFSMLQAEQLASGSLNGVSGKFVFKNGRMNSDDLLFKSPFGQLGYKGSVGLDTTLQGVLNLQITNAACQSSSMLRQLVGKQPALNLPVGLKGTLFSPAIDLNIQALLKETATHMIGDAVKEKAADALSGMLGGKKKLSVATTTASTEPQNIKDAVMQELGNVLTGKKKPATVVPAPVPSGSLPAPDNTPSTTPAPTPVPQESPDKQLKNEIKNIGKDLKNIFKF
ncbi:MAG: hypothetical protein HQM09_02125 [Candidatus Riflebacteria bacterium]|nr:hypothetical protein [Candidatus Riflebacteria bacterium]